MTEAQYIKNLKEKIKKETGEDPVLIFRNWTRTNKRTMLGIQKHWKCRWRCEFKKGWKM